MNGQASSTQKRKAEEILTNLVNSLGPGEEWCTVTVAVPDMRMQSTRNYVATLNLAFALQAAATGRTIPQTVTFRHPLTEPQLSQVRELYGLRSESGYYSFLLPIIIRMLQKGAIEMNGNREDRARAGEEIIFSVPAAPVEP